MFEAVVAQYLHLQITPADNGQLEFYFWGFSCLPSVLTVLTMALCQVGHISGDTLILLFLWTLAGGRFPVKDLVPYILAQCIGAIAAAALFTINGGAGDGSACICNQLL